MNVCVQWANNGSREKKAAATAAIGASNKTLQPYRQPQPYQDAKLADQIAAIHVSTPKGGYRDRWSIVFRGPHHAN
jgi:hypothetical protein